MLPTGGLWVRFQHVENCFGESNPPCKWSAEAQQGIVNSGILGIASRDIQRVQPGFQRGKLLALRAESPSSL